jgi:hypothetical protein
MLRRMRVRMVINAEDEVEDDKVEDDDVEKE